MIELKNVSYRYPFSERNALTGISLSVAPGEAMLCTGVSGCGKTTLIRLLNGLCPHYYGGELKGEVLLGGISNTERRLEEISEIAGTLFQDPENQFFALAVEDEMAFAHEWKGLKTEEINALLDRQVARYGLEKIRHSDIHELSEGQKQKVGLAGITMNDVKVLILDEPTANLDPEATEELAEEIKRLKAEGTAVLIADHRLYWLKDVVDKVAVFHEGKIVCAGDFSVLDEETRSKYGLRGVEVEDPRKTLKCVSESRTQEPLIGFENLSFAYKGKEALFENSALHIGAGISAVIGSNGAGKTTLARILTGLNKTSGGDFYVRGKKTSRKDLLRRTAIVLQNADHQLHMRTVFDEVRISLEINGCPESEREAQALLELFDLSELAGRHPQSLSGGQKQRLVIACALAKDPDVIILDEPTSGLDGVNMRRCAEVLRKLAAKGKAVLLITHDLELMNSVCASAVRLPLAKAS